MKAKALVTIAVVIAIALTAPACGGSATIPEVGDKAPGFTLTTINGDTLRLSDFRGKIVLLVFTSVNCKECEDQMPYLLEVYQRAQGELVVLNIYHIIYDARIIKDYVTEKQLTTFPVLPDPENKTATAYGVTRFPPTNFIIDTEGFVRYKKVGPFQSSQEIEDILQSL
ncbi:MAG TPA: peroxiredoxin family protein [Dehalococcoidia bacterium]|nr:peroxiredoxin family protein [Dehalococcoidia bacterium]